MQIIEVLRKFLSGFASVFRLDSHSIRFRLVSIPAVMAEAISRMSRSLLQRFSLVGR